MKQSSFDVTISALDAETSAFWAATSTIAQRSFDATISTLDAETFRAEVTGDIGAELPAISARSSRRLQSWYNSADV